MLSLVINQLKGDKMRKSEKYTLNFAKRHPDSWHSFSKDACTKNAVRNLEIKQHLTVSWETMQFKFDTKVNS